MPDRENTGCARCEVLPASFSGTGRLYIWLPGAHGASLLKGVAERSKTGFSVCESRSGEDVTCLLHLDPAGLDRFTEEMGQAFSPQELEDARFLLVPEDREPDLSEFRQVASMNLLFLNRDARWLTDILQQERLTSFFQPLFRVGKTGKQGEIPFAHECLLRVKEEDGSYAPPGRVFTVARKTDRLFHLDFAARSLAVRSAARTGTKSRIFVNFSPAAIYDPDRCLRRTVRLISELGLSPEQVVFEVIESDQVRDMEHLRRIITWYRKAGFRIALDDLGSGFSSLNMLHELRPDFVKMDMDLVRNVDQDPFKATILARLLETARDLGIQSVAEGVETEGEFDWVCRNGANLVQGWYLARPAEAPLA